MTNERLLLPLEFKTYWLHSRGEGGGADYDLVMEVDADGLPKLTGRHVTGLLRLALESAQHWGWFNDLPQDAKDDAIPDLLLGGRSPKLEPGCLDVRSAFVPDRLRAHLTGQVEVAACFRRLSTTAIDTIPGSAKAHQLRSVEAAFPLPLEAELSFEPEMRRAWAKRDAAEETRIAKAQANWRRWVDLAWPAFEEAGAKRTRGFGRLGWRELELGDV